MDFVALNLQSQVTKTLRSPFKRRWSCLSPTLLTLRLHLQALYAAKVQQKQPRLSLSFVPCAALHDTINAHWVPLGAALMANAAPLCWLPQWFHSSWQQVTRTPAFSGETLPFGPMSIWERGASHSLKTRFYPTWQTILRAASYLPSCHHLHAWQASLSPHEAPATVAACKKRSAIQSVIHYAKTQTILARQHNWRSLCGLL